jgi:hypothetical protein
MTLSLALLMCSAHFGGSVVFRDLHTSVLGQITHRLDESKTEMFHQEADGVAVHAAAEAVVRLPCRIDAETRRLFAVKRTQTHVIRARFPQRHMSPHHFDDVDSVQQILDERRRNHRDSLAAQFAGRPQADNA